MTANVRRRRRKIDPDYEKEKRVKKAAKNVGAVASSVIPFATAAQKIWNKPAKKVKRKKPVTGMLEKQGYMDLYETPTKKAKKKRKFTKVDEEV